MFENRKPYLLKIFSLCSLYLSTTWVTAQDQDLAHFYQLAKQSNPSLKISAAERQIVESQHTQAAAALRPSLNLNGRYNQVFDTSISNGSQYGYTLSLDQVLYAPSIDIGLTQANLNIQKAELSYQTAAQNLMLQVASSYFSILKAQNNLEFSKNNKATVHKQLKQSQQKFEVGVSAITDVRDAEARYDLAIAEEIAANNQLQISLEQLRELVGAYEQTPSRLKGKLELKNPEPADIDAWVSSALAQQPSLKVSRLQAQIAAQEIEKRRSVRKPTVNLQLNHGYNYNNVGFADGGSLQHSAGVVLNLPIDISGRIRANTAESKILHQQSLDNTEQQSRRIQQQTRAAYLNVVSTISQVKALRQALRSSSTAYEATQTSFEVGSRTIVDVLNAQRSYLQTQRDLAAAGYDYLLNTLRLKQAVGSLSETDLNNISKAYSTAK